MKLESIYLKNQLRKNTPLYLVMTATFALLFIFNAFIIKVISISLPEDMIIHFTSSFFFFCFVAFAFYYVIKIYYGKLWRQYKVWSVFGAMRKNFCIFVIIDFLITIALGLLIGITIDFILSWRLLLDDVNHIYLTALQVLYSVSFEVILALIYYAYIYRKFRKAVENNE